MLRPRLLILDLDGTLLDTLADITALLGRALAAHGLSEPAASAVRGFLGDGARTLVARAVSSDRRDLVPAVLERYLAEYAADPTPKTEAMPHAAALLAALPALSIRAAVCTNKRGELARVIAARRGLPIPAELIVGAGDCPRSKPYADPLLLLLERAGVPATDAWMVGDSAQDVLAAHAAAVTGVAVTNGYGDPALLAAASPELVCADLGALLEHLQALAAPPAT